MYLLIELDRKYTKGEGKIKQDPPGFDPLPFEKQNLNYSSPLKKSQNLKDPHSGFLTRVRLWFILSLVRS